MKLIMESWREYLNESRWPPFNSTMAHLRSVLLSQEPSVNRDLDIMGMLQLIRDPKNKEIALDYARAHGYSIRFDSREEIGENVRNAWHHFVDQDRTMEKVPKEEFLQQAGLNETEFDLWERNHHVMGDGINISTLRGIGLGRGVFIGDPEDV